MVIKQVDDGQYEEAIEKLEVDIKEKLDVDGEGGWLVTLYPELVAKVDLIISILETL